MKVALAIWNGRISPVFDVARQLLLLEIVDGKVIDRREEVLPGTELQAQARRLTALAPQALICGAISRPLAALLAAAPIKVVPFTAGTVEDVLAAWLAGKLPQPALCMPGCGCRRRQRCPGGRAGGAGRRWAGRPGPDDEAAEGK